MLGFLTRWFFRPGYKIAQNAEGTEVEDSEGQRRRFILTADNTFAPSLRGYYMAEVCCLGQCASSSARFSAWDGATESDATGFTLLLKPGEASKRVILVSSETKSLLVELDNKLIQADSLFLRLVPLSQGQAWRFIRKKLFKRNRQFQLTVKDGAAGIKSAAGMLAEWWPFYSRIFRLAGSRITYSQWISDTESFLWSKAVTEFPLCFSLIVPVFNSRVEWLQQLVESVQAQTYSNWQLVLVDDASDQPDTCAALLNLAESDHRIELVTRKINGHISRATNTGIELASGEYILFLDHDDYLAPQALNEFFLCIRDNPRARFIYSDEDLVTEEGLRHYPHFKSGWNPDLLLSHNYLTHLACYRSDTLRELGGMRTGYEGAQDYDLALRALVALDAGDIVHIPKVLYHWRMVDGSTAKSSTNKNYATEAGLRALTDYLQLTGKQAVVEHDVRPNFYRVRWPLPKVLPKVSVIIPTRDAVGILKPCIDSILETVKYPLLEIVIVDNDSVEEATADYFRSLLSDRKVTQPDAVSVRITHVKGEFNFSRLINEGVRTSTGDVILLLNNDTQAITTGWIEEMLSHACRSDIGCVGAKLLYPDMTIQHAGVILGLGGYAAHSHRGLDREDGGYFSRAQTVQNLSAVTAACLMVRRSVFEEVGGFNESYAVAYNDVDFCLKVMQKGYRNLYTPFAELIHYESKTRGEDSTPEKQLRLNEEKARLIADWDNIIQHDPFYNPNLTRSREDFSFRADNYTISEYD